MQSFRSLLACVFVLLAPLSVAAQAVPNAAGGLTNMVQRPRPPLRQAQQILASAEAAATKKGLEQTCVVVDSRGDVVALFRMDRARFWATDVAAGKARLAAFLGQPTSGLGDLAESPLLARLEEQGQGRVYAIGGGLPIKSGDEVVGALGCGGAGPQQDEDTAKAGLMQ
jgi:uncharacterized protein GlcG (DUF336 family)